MSNPTPADIAAQVAAGALQPVASPAPGNAPDLRSFNVAHVKQTRDFDTLIPDGTALEGTIQGAKLRQNENSGNWQVAGILDVDFPAAYAGQSVWINATITCENPFVYASMIRATDLCDEAGNFTGASVEALNGKRVAWTNKVDDYQGKLSNKHGAFRHAKNAPCKPGAPAAAPAPAPVSLAPTLPPGVVPPTPGVAATPVVPPQPAPVAPQAIPADQMAAYQAFLAQQAAAAPTGQPDFSQVPNPGA